jgi:hypothetical protein
MEPSLISNKIPLTWPLCHPTLKALLLQLAAPVGQDVELVVLAVGHVELVVPVVLAVVPVERDAVPVELDVVPRQDVSPLRAFVKCVPNQLMSLFPQIESRRCRMRCRCDSHSQFRLDIGRIRLGGH